MTRKFVFSVDLDNTLVIKDPNGNYILNPKIIPLLLWCNLVGIPIVINTHRNPLEYAKLVHDPKYKQLILGNIIRELASFGIKIAKIITGYTPLKQNFLEDHLQAIEQQALKINKSLQAKMPSGIVIDAELTFIGESAYAEMLSTDSEYLNFISQLKTQCTEWLNEYKEKHNQAYNDINQHKEKHFEVIAQDFPEHEILHLDDYPKIINGLISIKEQSVGAHSFINFVHPLLYDQNDKNNSWQIDAAKLLGLHEQAFDLLEEYQLNNKYDPKNLLPILIYHHQNFLNLKPYQAKVLSYVTARFLDNLGHLLPKDLMKFFISQRNEKIPNVKWQQFKEPWYLRFKKQFYDHKYSLEDVPLIPILEFAETQEFSLKDFHEFSKQLIDPPNKFIIDAYRNFESPTEQKPYNWRYLSSHDERLREKIQQDFADNKLIFYLGPYQGGGNTVANAAELEIQPFFKEHCEIGFLGSFHFTLCKKLENGDFIAQEYSERPDKALHHFNDGENTFDKANKISDQDDDPALVIQTTYWSETNQETGKIYRTICSTVHLANNAPFELRAKLLALYSNKNLPPKSQAALQLGVKSQIQFLLEQNAKNERFIAYYQLLPADYRRTFLNALAKPAIYDDSLLHYQADTGFFNLKANFKNIVNEHGEIDVNRQKLLLHMLSDYSYASLELSGCIALNDELLTNILKKSPQLKYLDVSFCPNITSISILYLAKNCIQLETLYLSYSGIEKIADQIAGLSRPIQFPKLRILQAAHCRNLQSIDICASQIQELKANTCQNLIKISCESILNKLARINVNQCTKLKTLQFNAPQLMELNILGCKTLEFKCLLNIAAVDNSLLQDVCNVLISTDKTTRKTALHKLGQVKNSTNKLVMLSLFTALNNPDMHTAAIETFSELIKQSLISAQEFLIVWAKTLHNIQEYPIEKNTSETSEDIENADAIILALIEVLQEQQQGFRDIAVSAVNELKFDYEQRNLMSLKNQLDSFTKDLHDNSIAKRVNSLIIFGKLPGANKAVMSVLSKALKNENPDIRACAAAILVIAKHRYGLINFAIELDVSALIKDFENGSESCKIYMASVLASLGYTNETIIALLLHALRDNSNRVAQNFVIEIFANLKKIDEICLSALYETFYNNRGSEIGWRAANTLCQLKKANEPIVNELRKALNSANLEVSKSDKLRILTNLAEAGSQHETTRALIKYVFENFTLSIGARGSAKTTKDAIQLLGKLIPNMDYLEKDDRFLVIRTLSACLCDFDISVSKITIKVLCQIGQSDETKEAIASNLINTLVSSNLGYLFAYNIKQVTDELIQLQYFSNSRTKLFSAFLTYPKTLFSRSIPDKTEQDSIESAQSVKKYEYQR